MKPYESIATFTVLCSLVSLPLASYLKYQDTEMRTTPPYTIHGIALNQATAKTPHAILHIPGIQFKKGQPLNVKMRHRYLDENHNKHMDEGEYLDTEYTVTVAEKTYERSGRYIPYRK